MVDEIKFNLTKDDAEDLWRLLSNAPVAKLHPDPGVPFATYELRLTLAKHRQIQDEDDDPSSGHFPKTMEWKIPRHLLVILKLVLKAAVKITSGETFERLVALCKILQLEAWFRKTFKKPFSIDLGDDDCEMDDEIEKDVATAAD